MTTTKYSLAAKAKWAKIPKEERTKRMRLLAKKKHEKITPEAWDDNLKKMLEARKK